MKLDIIYEDKEIIVCYKPPGVATQTASLGSPDMVSMLKNYLAKKGEGTYLGVIHRLDQPVSGLLVFAKTQKAAASLSKQIQDGNASVVLQSQPLESVQINFSWSQYSADLLG